MHIIVALQKHSHSSRNFVYSLFFLKIPLNVTIHFFLCSIFLHRINNRIMRLLRILKYANNYCVSRMRLVRRRLHGFRNPRPPLNRLFFGRSYKLFLGACLLLPIYFSLIYIYRIAGNFQETKFSMITSFQLFANKFSRYKVFLGMGGVDILAYDYCKAKISRLSRLLLQLYLC